MSDSQLNLAAVQRQFQDSEGKLRDIAEQLGSLNQARESLDDAASTLGESAELLAEVARELAESTSATVEASDALRQSNPGEVKDRLTSLEATSDSHAGALVSLQRTTNLIRILVIVTLVAAIAAAVLSVTGA